MLNQLITDCLAYHIREGKSSTNIQDHLAILMGNYITGADLEKLRGIPPDSPALVVKHLEKKFNQPFKVYPQAIAAFLENQQSLGLSDQYLTDLEACMGAYLHAKLEKWLSDHTSKQGTSLLRLKSDTIVDKLYDILEAMPGIQFTISHETLPFDVFSWPFQPAKDDNKIENLLTALDASILSLQNRFDFKNNPVATVIINSLKFWMQKIAHRTSRKYGLRGLFVTEWADQTVRGSVHSVSVQGIYASDDGGGIFPTFHSEEKFGEILKRAHKAALAYLRIKSPEQWQLAKDCNLYVSIGELPAKFDGPSIGLTIALAIVAWALREEIGIKSPGDVAVTGDIIEQQGKHLINKVGQIPAKIQAVLEWNKTNPNKSIRLVLVPKGDNLQEARDTYRKARREGEPHTAIAGICTLDEVVLL